jgi:peroxiredoxin
MKQKIFQSLAFILLLLTSVITRACDQGQTTVTCFVHYNSGSAVSIYKVVNGEAIRMESRWPGEQDSCLFRFQMEKEGVYYLHKGGGNPSEHNYVIYLKPGENKSVDLYSNKLKLDFDSCKIVKPNPETVALQKWLNLFNNFSRLGQNRANREKFIAAYNNFESTAEQFKNKAITANDYFNFLFASKIDAEIKYLKAAAFFNHGERMNADYDSSKIHQSFYQSLGSEKFCDAGVLYSPHGMQLLNYWLTFYLFQKSGSMVEALASSIADKMGLLCNDTVRGAFLTRYMMGVTNYEQFAAEIEPFKTSLATNEMKQAYQRKLDEITKYAKGVQAYNFSLNDQNEKLFSLSDFKGKVVVLDIWAMWCAPCLAEKPHFQKIEEEYSNRQDIVFIGVSVDGYAKKEAWKNFVTKKVWKNIELLSDFDESIMKYYNIDGIPRFMIFDKEGKVITVDAPRPSEPEFRSLIEETLKNNS